MLRRNTVYRRLGLAGCTLALALTLSGPTFLPAPEIAATPAATQVIARRQPDRRATRERPLPLKTPGSQKNTVQAPTPTPRAAKPA
ncbi:MAG TPA: hypothetical protein VNK95_17290 [Caldilineaceae bacterium]|nr:hypothetical protein [Caldilineaceae bacterium]